MLPLLSFAMIRIGLAGVGHLGQHHNRLLERVENAVYAGCFDIDPAVQQEQRKQGVQVYPSFQALVDDVDAVDIVTPTNEHFPLAKEALQAGKHVFIEKPMTETPAQAKELIELADSHGLKLQIGHIERFNPAVRALRDFDLAPRFIESHRLAQFQPRGTEVAVILDLMIHDIDIILSLVDSPVAEVDASGVAVVTDSVDISNARVTFENGCVANITASRISQKAMRKLRIFQQSAYISIDFLTQTTEIYRLKTAGNEDSESMPVILGEMEFQGSKKYIVYEQPDIEESNALLDELQTFVHAIHADERPVVSGEDGLRALEVARLIETKVAESSVAQ